MNPKELPEAIEMEKQLLSAMFMKDGQVVPDVAVIIEASDLYRVEHRLIFQAIMRLYAKGETIDHLYLLSLIDTTNTTVCAEYLTNKQTCAN